MDRRGFVSGSLTAFGTAAAFGALGGTAHASQLGGTNVIASTSKCIATGLACNEHCKQMLAEGAADFAACQRAVEEMLVACTSVLQLASSQSKYAKDFAKICAQVCRDCAAACEPHLAHSEVCKACFDACQGCQEACQSFSA